MPATAGYEASASPSAAIETASAAQCRGRLRDDICILRTPFVLRSLIRQSPWRTPRHRCVVGYDEPSIDVEARKRAAARRVPRSTPRDSEYPIIKPLVSTEPRLGDDSGWHRRLTHACDRFCRRHTKGRRSGLGADLRGLRAGAAWLAEKKPDVLFFVYNDHVTSFFFDHYSAFTLGIGETFPVADEGGGPRPLPAVKGHPALAQHIAHGRSWPTSSTCRSSRSEPLDHGVFSPLSMLCRTSGEWPARDRPAAGRRAAVPDSDRAALLQARPGRCAARSRAIRRTSRSRSSATGGLSHQVHGERAGFNNTTWDMEFLDLIENDPERSREMTHRRVREARRLRGRRSRSCGSSCAARCRPSAQGAPVLLPAVDDGIATAIYEDLAEDDAERDARRVSQASGQERVRRSSDARGHLSVHVRAQRRGVPPQQVSCTASSSPSFAAGSSTIPKARSSAAGLTEEERDLVRRLDWRGSSTTASSSSCSRS